MKVEFKFHSKPDLRKPFAYQSVRWDVVRKLFRPVSRSVPYGILTLLRPGEWGPRRTLV